MEHRTARGVEYIDGRARKNSGNGPITILSKDRVQVPYQGTASSDRASLLYQRAKAARENPTKHERILWNELTNRGLQSFFQSQVVFLPDYFVDFYCRSRRLVIEIDGPIHDTQRSYDAARDNELRSRRCIVLRFTNSQIEDDVAGVVQRLIDEYDIRNGETPRKYRRKRKRY